MDYLYIRAWGKQLGSFAYYIEGEVQRARESNAPQTAIYRNQDGTWSTFEEIHSDDTKARIQRAVDEMKEARK